jgi:hypothetical protein
MTQDEVGGLMRGIAPVFQKYIDEKLDELRDNLADSLKYRGVWTEDDHYEANDLMTHGGSLHLAIHSNTGERPGQGLPWWLIVKSDEARVRRLVKQEMESYTR